MTIMFDFFGNDKKYRFEFCTLNDLRTTKEFSSEMIKDRMVDYFGKGKTIDYLPPSKTQEKYVFGTHGFRSGRIGWFEVK